MSLINSQILIDLSDIYRVSPQKALSVDISKNKEQFFMDTLYNAESSYLTAPESTVEMYPLVESVG